MPRDLCPVCDAPAPPPFLVRRGVPVHQNVLFDTAAAARAMPRGDLDMRACGACGFVFNAAFDPGLVDYGPSYENSQDCSPAFNSHLDALADHLVLDRGIRAGRVVEVGCGKGVFLRKLLSHPANACTAVGFDPSYLGPLEILDGRARFVRDFYGPETAVPADAVICRHVIEHVPDPVALLRTVRAAIGASGATRVFFETPCVAWILRNGVAWDFFYEHCSLFTAHSLSLAFERAGFAVVGVRHVFGGQYLWLEGSGGSPTRCTSGPPCSPISRRGGRCLPGARGRRASPSATSPTHAARGWPASSMSTRPSKVDSSPEPGTRSSRPKSRATPRPSSCSTPTTSERSARPSTASGRARKSSIPCSRRLPHAPVHRHRHASRHRRGARSAR
ncbi:MAG: methyltransferase domain-containing protein, partial [Gemmataceae bacterium]|nr:methyltransferase domain-containing protein [Gemmataceae bacterium]